MGITSARDSFVIDFDKKNLRTRIKDFCDKVIAHKDFQLKYKLKENYQWKVPEQREMVAEFSDHYIKVIAYRPFDNRFIYYQENLVFRMRNEIMNNLNDNNIAFCTVKLGRNLNYHNYFLSKYITDKGISSSLDNANIFPLYLYPETNEQQSLEQPLTRTPNLDPELVEQIATGLGLEFVPEKPEGNLCFADTNEELQDAYKQNFAPIDLLDYIYAVLQYPAYREKYKEFLKIDFPRVPYPTDQDTFWKLVELGGELRQIHLLESPLVEQYTTGTLKDEKIVITHKLTKTLPGSTL